MKLDDRDDNDFIFLRKEAAVPFSEIPWFTLAEVIKSHPLQTLMFSDGTERVCSFHGEVDEVMEYRE